jgi:hypothetical protein
MQLLIGTVVIGVILMTLAALRITRIASWQAISMIAASTGSLKACVAFLRYCERL